MEIGTVVFVKTIYQQPDIGYVGKIAKVNDETLILEDVFEVQSLIDFENENEPLIMFRAIPFTPKIIKLGVLTLDRSLVLVYEEGYVDLYTQLTQNIKQLSKSDMQDEIGDQVKTGNIILNNNKMQ